LLNFPKRLFVGTLKISDAKTDYHEQKAAIAAEISFRFVNRCHSNTPTTSNNAQQLSPFRLRSRLCAVVGSVINSLLCGYVWA